MVYMPHKQYANLLCEKGKREKISLIPVQMEGKKKNHTLSSDNV